MFPKYHLLLGFMFSLILFIFCPKITLLTAIIIFLSSFLIDIDHYIFLAFNSKQKNIFKAYFEGIQLKKKSISVSKKQRKDIPGGFYLFHGVESLIILFLLGFFVNKVFYFILIGFLFHLVLDYLESFIYYSRNRKISTIFDYIYFKKSNKTLKNKSSW